MVTILLSLALAPSAHAEPLFSAPFLSFGTGENPESVAIADLNADGRLDLATANHGCQCSPSSGGNTVSVLLGNGDGTFGPHTDFDTATGPLSVAIADLNTDGRPDLVTANYGAGDGNTVSVLLGNGDGTFGPRTDFRTGSIPTFVAIADFNADGWPDLATANYGYQGTGNTVSVLLGNGDGTFRPKTDFGTGSGPLSVAIADLNADGHPDLAVANTFSDAVSVLLGNSTGTFGPKTDFGTGSTPRSVAIADLDADGRADLVTANYGNGTGHSVSVLLGNGDGTFRGKNDFGTGSGPLSVAIRDLDADGWLDLAVSSYYSGTVSVLLGNGDGMFGPETDYGSGNFGSVAVGDLNADGQPDLALANTLDAVTVLLHTTPPLAVGGPSVGLALSGSVPNPSRDLSVSFTLPDARPAKLVVYDVSGREVSRREVGSLGAGRHMVTLGGHGLVPGIYLVHLIQGDRRLVARAVVAR